jgi:opacity protein-like surface antigen
MTMRVQKAQRSGLRALFLAGLVATFPLLPAAAFALTMPEPGFSIGPRAAWYNSDDSDDDVFYGGAQARLHLTPALAVEGSIDYRRTEFGPTETHVYPVQASLLAYLVQAPLSPFLLGGAGWYYTTVEGPGGFDETDHRFGLHAGFGLQAFFSEYISVDGTYRFVWVESIESQDESLLSSDYDDNGHMITVGLNLHFH